MRSGPRADAALLPRGFFDRPAFEVAPDLLGHVLEHEAPDGTVAIVLTEAEAYAGPFDPASHAYRGPTARNGVMFGPPGHVYVYFTYGMHFCVNLVCQAAGSAAAVLLRAGRVVSGIQVARRRRAGAGGVRSPADRDLARGPARLCQAMAIGPALNGADACDPASRLRVLRADAAAPAAIRSGPRTGVRGAANVPWRFWIAGEPTVSPYRPHAAHAAPGQQGTASTRR